MATLIICNKTDCMYARKRIDSLYQCHATTIGINAKNECDTYGVLPKGIRFRCISCGKGYDTVEECNACEETH